MKCKYAELVPGLQANAQEEDAVSEGEVPLSINYQEGFNIVREAAQNKLQGGDFCCEKCRAPCGNRESFTEQSMLLSAFSKARPSKGMVFTMSSSAQPREV